MFLCVCALLLLTNSSQWTGHNDTPRLCSMLQQQGGYFAVSQGVPVGPILCAMLQGEAEMKVEVQHIQPIGISQSPAIVIGFNHIITQVGRLVLDLW